MMSIKAPALAAAVLLILALATPACADEAFGTLAPREVFVGDMAVFTYIEENLHFYRLFGELAPGAAFEVPRELIPPDTADISLKGVRLIPLQGREDAALCEIAFVPWKTGEVLLPQIAFTPDGARRSKAIKINVASLAALSGAASLMPNRPPLLPPGTLFLLYALVLLVAAACFAAFFAARRLLEWQRSPRRILAKRVRREFAKLISELRLRIEKNERGWYAELAGLARLFFYRMTGCKSLLAANARDIARLLEGAASGGSREEATSAKRLIALLFQIEKIRFSGEGGTRGEREERALKCNYIEDFEEFVCLACAHPSSFFKSDEASAEDESPPLAMRAFAALAKKVKRRAVV